MELIWSAQCSSFRIWSFQCMARGGRGTNSIERCASSFGANGFVVASISLPRACCRKSCLFRPTEVCFKHFGLHSKNQCQTVRCSERTHEVGRRLRRQSPRRRNKRRERRLLLMKNMEKAAKRHKSELKNDLIFGG